MPVAIKGSDDILPPPNTDFNPGYQHFFFGSMAVSAKGLQVGQWNGDVQLSGDYIRTDSRSFDITQTNETRRTEERLSLRNTGTYIIDPRFISFLFGATFGLTQERSLADASGQEVLSEERDADILGYIASANFFTGSDWSLNLFSNRNKYTQRRQLAGRIETDVQNTGASVRARRLYIPSTLTLRREQAKEKSHLADITTQRNETRNVITYDGRRGWIDSEMILRYEFVDKADVYRPELDYDSQNASMSYSRDFGAELNRRWDSRLRGSKRNGYSEEKRFEVDELLRIDHNRNLRSQYRYYLTDTRRTLGNATSRTAEFNISHQLYESLTTKFRANANSQDLSGGEKKIYAGRLSLDYTKRVIGNGRLFIGVAGYYAKEDDQFENLAAQFIQEVHSFEAPFPRPLALDNAFVIESSVVVIRTAKGTTSECDTERPLVEGVDYELRTLGNETEIVPLGDCAIDPGIGIGAGDSIAVDYQATVPQQLAFTSTSWRVMTSLDYGWIRPFFIHDEQQQQLDSGNAQQEQFLQDRQLDTAGVELRYSNLSARATMLVEAERYRSRDQNYYALRANQFLQFHMSSSWRLNLNARQSAIRFSTPEVRRTEIIDTRATLRQLLGMGLSTEFVASWRFIRDTIVPDEEVRQASMQLNWRIGKLEVKPGLHYIQRIRDTTDLKDYRALVHAIRRF